MFNKSIAYHLSVYISIAVISIFLLFVFFNRQVLRENIEHQAIGVSEKVNVQINRSITKTRDVTQNISKQIIYYGRNGDAEKLLSMVMEDYPFIHAIYITVDSTVAMPNHHFILKRDNGVMVFKESKQESYFNENEKKIHHSLPAMAGEGWTQPYQSPDDGELKISYFCPVRSFFRDGEADGIVFCELSLTEFNDIINQIKIGEKGYAFVVDKKGTYITHPSEEKILRDNLFELSSRVINRQKIDIQTIFDENLTGSAIVHPERLGFEKSWVYYTPINQGRWYLIFIMPFRELFDELYAHTTYMFIFAALGILAVILIITYISNRLILPLRKVTRQLTRLSRPRDEDQGKNRNEVKLVSDSLKYLSRWFEDYKTARDEELLKIDRRREDLQQASEIQQSLIKTKFPAFPDRTDIDLHAIYQPAAIVSGDLFDFFFIDDENLLISIGDVSGKGVPAAIFMSIAQTLIKNNSSYKKAKSIVQKVNKDLFTSNKHQFFLTLFLGVLNVKTGEINYCNAAHTIPYLLKFDGRLIALKQSHGLPLGLYYDTKFKDSRIGMEKGDKLILYTDGLTEQQDAEQKHYGPKRLKEGISRSFQMNPGGVIGNIEESLRNFRGKAGQSDDICMFVIEYKTTPA